ncbi:hypothetical protein ACHM18_01440 [Clostridium perfringens]
MLVIPLILYSFPTNIVLYDSKIILFLVTVSDKMLAVPKIQPSKGSCPSVLYL